VGRARLTTVERSGGVQVEVDLDGAPFGRLRITPEGLRWAQRPGRHQAIQADWRDFDALMKRHLRSQERRRRLEALEERLSALWAAMETPEQREVLVAVAELQKRGGTFDWVDITNYLEKKHRHWSKHVHAVLARLRRNLDDIERERPESPLFEWPIPPRRSIYHTRFTREARLAILRRSGQTGYVT
jgi:hypothetical protein